jgi:hypothetical protein
LEKVWGRGIENLGEKMREIKHLINFFVLFRGIESFADLKLWEKTSGSRILYGTFLNSHIMAL